MRRTWLKMHITEVLALLWTMACIAVFFVVLLSHTTLDDKTTFLIVGNMYGIAMLIAGFYWGSSKIPTRHLPEQSEIAQKKGATEESV